MTNQLETANKLLQEEKYEAALKSFITYTEAHPNDSVGYINIGNIFTHLHQFDEASSFYLKALEKDEKSGIAYYGLGNICYLKGIYDEAELMFNKAIQVGLQDADVYYLLGMTHVKRENNILALPFLQRAAELADDGEISFQYGLLLAKMNYLTEAEHVFTDILKQKGSHTDSMYNLAIIYFQRGEYEEAKNQLEKVLTIDAAHMMAKNALVELNN